MALIVVDGLSKVYNEGQENEVVALKNASFSVEQGEFVVILGASGSGKSTLLNILGGMDQASAGKYEMGGENIVSLNTKKLGNFRRKNVGFVFQFYNLIPNLTALENVQLAASMADEPLDSKETLGKVGLDKRLDNFPSQLSGGEQQRVAIARALVKNPDLLLCDEPTGALDSKTGGQIIKLLSDVAKQFKKTVIMVTHNSKIAQCAGRLIRISDGQIVEDTINDNIVSPETVDW
ncbi:MAG: ABC transporter ATP-binding protein [Bacillota bacterium]|nr:ABC transporter ATP-binding protein [Bacillota bacterium]